MGFGRLRIAIALWSALLAPAALSSVLLSSVLLASVLLSSVALAQEPVPSLDLRGFNPPADPKSGIYYEPASSPATFDWNAALWNSYSWRPVTLRDPVADEVRFKVIEHQLSGDVIANVGILERIAFGIDLPYVAYQTGDEPTPEATAVLGNFSVPHTALGDLKVLLKGTLIPPTSGEFGGFALALHERLGLPTGNEESYLGEGHVTSETRILAEYRYLAASFHVALGFKLRAEEEPYGCTMIALLGASCDTTFGNEIPWGLAVVFLPQAVGIDDGGHWTWFVESYGYLPAGPETPFTNASVSQAQLGGGVRYSFANDISLLAGLDAALVGGIGTSPVRATLSVQWAPRKHDLDDDGVRDEDDLCGDLVEDVDGFEDNDGCPDWDNDDDGVPDETDRCKGPREDEDGFADDDGCPDPDNDGDRILDAKDACPNAKGVASADPKKNGCADNDPDKDRVLGDADRCPNEPEDPDGFADTDGCIDPDNDEDGIADKGDACPDLKGVKYPAKPEDDGCPDGDADGIPDGKDACPAQAGVASDDPQKHGCVAAPAGRPPR
jgi:hypothetical protein